MGTSKSAEIKRTEDIYLQETPLFYRYSSVDAPSILHRYSIDGPSFRWRIDGVSMEYLKSFKGGICLFTP